MRSIGMQFRQLLLIGQLRLDRSSENAARGIITSESVLSKDGHLP